MKGEDVMIKLAGLHMPDPETIRANCLKQAQQNNQKTEGDKPKMRRFKKMIWTVPIAAVLMLTMTTAVLGATVPGVNDFIYNNISEDMADWMAGPKITERLERYNQTVEPTDPVEPANPVEPIGPIGPIEPTEPTEPIVSVSDANYTPGFAAPSFEDEYYGMFYSKDFKVPYINGNTADIKNANAAIKQAWAKVVALYNKGVAGYWPDNNGARLFVDVCTYETYRNGDILSVIVWYGFGATDVVRPEYLIYNFDVNTGKLLPYKDIYTAAGFTAQNIEAKVSAAITSYLVNEHGEEEATRDYPGEWAEGKTSVIASINRYKKAVSNGSILYFLGANGKLFIEFELAVPAGNGSFPTVLRIK